MIMEVNIVKSLNVKVKKLVPQAVIPTYAKPGDAGMDLTAVEYEYDAKTDCHIYKSGLAFEIPEGYVGLLFPRSSNRKTDAYLTNCVGVIESGYRGDVMACFKNRDKGTDGEINQLSAPYEIGDRFAQLIIMPYPSIRLTEAEELSDSERGTGGYGSTGN